MKKIQFGVCGWCLDVKGVDVVKRASELGFRAMQIGVQSLDDVETLKNAEVQAAYLEASNDYGVKLLGISVSVFDYLCLFDPSNAETSRQVLYDMIDVSNALSMPLVFCPSFMASEIKSNDDLLKTASVLRDVCGYAKNRSVIFATENTLDVQGHKELLGAVNHPHLKVFVDCYNPVVFGSRAESQIRELKEVLADQIHAKDGINHVMGSASLGEGEGDFMSSVSAIKEIDYSGYIVLENNYDVQTEARIQKDMAVLEQAFNH